MLSGIAAVLIMAQASPPATATAPLDLDGALQCSTTFLTMSSVTAYSPEFRERQKTTLLRVFGQTEQLGQRAGIAREALLARMQADSTRHITSYFALPNDAARSTQRLRWMMDGLTCLRRAPATTTIVEPTAPAKAVALDLDSGVRCTAAALTATTLEKDATVKAANRAEFLAMAQRVLPIAERQGLTRAQMLDRIQANGEARLRQYHFGDAATQTRLVTGLATERADCRRRSTLTP